jgi:YegS/Rv2252/BmrU family lipid kinase
MKHLFIINPAAGSRDRTKYYTQLITQACDSKGLDYEIKVSQAPGDCAAIAKAAAQTGQPYKLYACGGDGTLNEVVAGAAGHDNVAVTVFSGGSGNDFTKLFDDPEAFRDIERLLDSQEETFDLIRCNGDASLNICSVGLDARIGTDVANYKRLPLLSGFRAYVVSAVVNVIRGISEHYIVEVDGQRIDEELTLVCACNGRFYGGGFNPVPDADPTDGLLDILLVKKVSRLKVLQVIGKYKDGKYAQYPELIRHFRAKCLRIICDKETPINLDGELRLGKQVDISIGEEKLRFFYPKGLSWSKAPAKV